MSYTYLAPVFPHAWCRCTHYGCNPTNTHANPCEDWFTAWPGDALVAVAEMFLASVEFDSDDTRRAIVESCQRFHEDTRVLSAEFLTKLKRQNYVTPTRYSAWRD